MPRGPQDRIELRMDAIKPLMEGIDVAISKTCIGEKVSFICQDKTLTEKELDYIKNEYKRVGWETFEYTTSAEVGEKTGLAEFILGMHGDK